MIFTIINFNEIEKETETDGFNSLCFPLKTASLKLSFKTYCF